MVNMESSEFEKAALILLKPSVHTVSDKWDLFL